MTRVWRVERVDQADRAVWLVVHHTPIHPPLSPSSWLLLVVLAVLVPVLGLLIGAVVIAASLPHKETGWRVTLSQRGLTVAWVRSLPLVWTALDGEDGRTKALRWDQIAAVSRSRARRVVLLRTDGVRVALPPAPPEVEAAWEAAIGHHLLAAAASAQPAAEAAQARARLARLTDR